MLAGDTASAIIAVAAGVYFLTVRFFQLRHNVESEMFSLQCMNVPSDYDKGFYGIECHRMVSIILCLQLKAPAAKSWRSTVDWSEWCDIGRCR